MPFEAHERDLWPIFSAIGPILELVILRSQGKSRGCAFVTYENRMLAEKVGAGGWGGGWAGGRDGGVGGMEGEGGWPGGVGGGG